MKEKLKKCPVCGKEVASGAAVCPNCGAKNKRPLYRRWWFWVLLIVIVGGIGSAMGGEPDPDPEQAEQAVGETAQPHEEQLVAYTEYTVKQLMDDLSGNALKAESTYQDQYVSLTGRLNVIDSSGDYISITPAGDTYAILGVQCYLQNEEHRQQVMEMQIGDTITVRGQMIGVGEVLGYSLNVDDFGA